MNGTLLATPLNFVNQQTGICLPKLNSRASMHIHKISEEECLDILRQSKFGRLACVRDNQPYTVPVYFAFEYSNEGPHYLYGFTPPGQKVDWMRTNPYVCVEFDEVKGYNHWFSVIVFGRYEELPDTQEQGSERLKAHRLLQQQIVWWEPGYAAYQSHTSRDQSHAYTPLYYRIAIDRITGYRATPDGSSKTALIPGRKETWLRRVLNLFTKRQHVGR